MDKEECYEWAKIFISPWKELVKKMAERAKTLDLMQKEFESALIWQKQGNEHCRWVFIEDPSDIRAIRAVFNNDDNLKSTSCFVVVRQQDPSDDRGEIIFDIFRLNPESYLWHFNRVYTPPKASAPKA
ncbi:MAG: hypothetical protein ABIK28_22950 [Planctomycetota bacterium]